MTSTGAPSDVWSKSMTRATKRLRSLRRRGPRGPCDDRSLPPSSEGFSIFQRHAPVGRGVHGPRRRRPCRPARARVRLGIFPRTMSPSSGNHPTVRRVSRALSSAHAGDRRSRIRNLRRPHRARAWRDGDALHRRRASHLLLDEATLTDLTKNVRGNPVLFPSPGKLIGRLVDPRQDGLAWFARSSKWEVRRTRRRAPSRCAHRERRDARRLSVELRLRATSSPRRSEAPHRASASSRSARSRCRLARLPSILPPRAAGGEGARAHPYPGQAGVGQCREARDRDAGAGSTTAKEVDLHLHHAWRSAALELATRASTFAAPESSSAGWCGRRRAGLRLPPRAVDELRATR